MKKALIIVSLLAVGLAACDKRDNTTPVEPPALNPAPPMSVPADPMTPPSADPMARPAESGVPHEAPAAPAHSN